MLIKKSPSSNTYTPHEDPAIPIAKNLGYFQIWSLNPQFSTAEFIDHIGNSPMRANTNALTSAQKNVHTKYTQSKYGQTSQLLQYFL